MLGLLLCLWTGGCHTQVSSSPEEQFSMLFDGFRLLLVDDLPARTPIQELYTSDLRNTYPSERTLMPERVYAFRKTTNTSNERLAIKIFPKRLLKIGARVTKAPHSRQEFIFLYIGGPLFLIEFEKDGHKGTMFNRVRVSPHDNWEELIVAYK